MKTIAATLLSVFAQFLLTRKILENWTLWIVADVVYIGVYTSKSLYWTAGLYVVFLVLCIQGYREWKAPATASVTSQADPGASGTGSPCWSSPFRFPCGTAPAC